MVIEGLSREECLDLLARTKLARLAVVHNGQPYIVPVYLVYDREAPNAPSLYGVTTLGEKIEWMRTDPRVCIEVDEIADFDQWESVVARGRYEELKDSATSGAGENPHLRRTGPTADLGHPSRVEPTARQRAFEILQERAMWWEPASTAWASRSAHKSGDRYEPVYYRINLEQITGHRASPGSSQSPNRLSSP